MVSGNRTDPADPARRCTDPGRSAVWLAGILTTVVGGLAGAYIGFFGGLMGFRLGPWGNQDWPEGLALHLGGPLLGAIAGAAAGATGRVRLGATVGTTTVALFLLLVVICTVVDLDQVVGVGLVLLIAGGLAGAAGGALSRLIARSHLAQLTLGDFLTILIGGLTGAFIGLCCGLVGSSMVPPSGDLVQAALCLGGPLFGAIGGALGGAVRRAWLRAMLAPTGPALFLVPVVLFTDVDPNQAVWAGGALLIAASVAAASGGIIGARMAGSRRFQFSLTAAFWGVFACALACGLLAVKGQHVKWCRERTVAQRRYKQLGVLKRLEHFQSFPDFGPGSDMVGLRLVALAPDESGDPNDELVHLKDLRMVWLDRLTIEGKAFNDAGLAALGSVLGRFAGVEVDELALNGTRITDAGLEHLKGFSGLQSLDLRGTGVTDDGAERLRQALPDCEIVR